METAPAAKTQEALLARTAPAPARRRRRRSLLLLLLRDWVAMTGCLLFLALVFTATLAPYIAPLPPSKQSLRDRLKPPAWLPGGTWQYPLGTDGQGRDVLSRIIYGSRVSLIVGLAVVGISGGFGVLLGLIAGYYHGRIDNAIMRLVDIQSSFPGLLIAMTIVAVVGPSLWVIVLVLALNAWMVYARVARGMVLSLRETQFIEAARATGCGDARIIVLHILPNLAAPLTTLCVLELARIILAEAALSFLGLGIQPPDVSWGLMISQGRSFVATSWWLVTFPGLAIALTVLSVNLIANWLRMAADPQQRSKLPTGH